MSLFRAELRRLAKRRFPRWMLLVVLAVMAATVVGAFALHTKPGPEAEAQARAKAEETYAEQQRWMELEIAECEQSTNIERNWGVTDCEEIRHRYGTEVEDMVEWFLPPAFEFRDDFPPMITVLTALLTAFGFIVGASFIGAEWRSGGMANLLVWQPRRLQVFLTKLGAVLVGTLGLGVLLGTVWTAAFWWVALQRGVADMSSGAWQSFALMGLRGVTLALVAAALGFAVASIGRHTAMALGAVVALAVAGYGMAVVMVMGGVSSVERWLYNTYLQAWMNKSVVIYDYAGCDWSMGQCLPREIEITWQTSGLLLAAILLVVLGAAMWHLRRRDVA